MSDTAARHHLYLLNRTYQALSAPSDHSPASGAATRPIGTDAAEPVDREGAERLRKFMARVHVPEYDFGCWEWIGAKNRYGYGVFYMKGRRSLAHRVSRELFVGPIPEGLVIDHMCRNTLCVNPIHLDVVTIRENVLRGRGPAAVAVRKTHCSVGHAYEADNTYTDRVGNRRCRECRRAERRAYYARARAIDPTWRWGAGTPGIDSRRHSVHVDHYACDPDERGGAA